MLATKKTRKRQSSRSKCIYTVGCCGFSSICTCESSSNLNSTLISYYFDFFSCIHFSFTARHSNAKHDPFLRPAPTALRNPATCWHPTVAPWWPMRVETPTRHSCNCRYDCFISCGWSVLNNYVYVEIFKCQRCFMWLKPVQLHFCGILVVLVFTFVCVNNLGGFEATSPGTCHSRGACTERNELAAQSDGEESREDRHVSCCWFESCRYDVLPSFEKDC